MIVRSLDNQNLNEFRALMSLFSEVFDQKDTYGANQPSDGYVMELLSKKHIIHLVALLNQQVVGGLVAYVLDKFEQERSEVYIYDLAVAAAYRRQGIATKLIEQLSIIARGIGAGIIVVHTELENDPAIKLYNRLGKREAVLLFDIKV